MATLQNPLYSVGMQGYPSGSDSKSTRTISGVNLPSDTSTAATDLETFAQLYYSTTTTTYNKTTLTTKQEVVA